MTAAVSWWVIIGVQPNPATGSVYSYFQGTQAQAQAEAGRVVQIAGQTNLKGPYATKAAAEAAVASGQVKPQTSSAGPQLNVGGNPVGNANDLTGLASIGDFFSRLTNANTWIRVGKVLVGGVLLIVGLAHMTGADNAAFKAARTVPLPV